MKHPAPRLLLAAVALATVLAGCSDEEAASTGGDPAYWEIDPQRPPQPTDKQVLALVSRSGCAGGVTGRVLAPVVKEDDQRVVVTFTVEARAKEPASCPGNEQVAQTVTLDEPLGERTLYDGFCPRPEGETDCESRQVWPILR